MKLLDKSTLIRHKRLLQAGGVQVTYRRGGESITTVDAVKSEVEHDEYGDELTSLTAREQDWIIWTDDLILAGTRWTPQRDDEIDWFDRLGVKRTYQVLPRAGDRCFRHTDGTEQEYRIHTVETLPNVE